MAKDSTILIVAFLAVIILVAPSIINGLGQLGAGILDWIKNGFDWTNKNATGLETGAVLQVVYTDGTKANFSGSMIPQTILDSSDKAVNYVTEIISVKPTFVGDSATVTITGTYSAEVWDKSVVVATVESGDIAVGTGLTLYSDEWFSLWAQSSTASGWQQTKAEIENTMKSKSLTDGTYVLGYKFNGSMKAKGADGTEETKAFYASMSWTFKYSQTVIKSISVYLQTGQG